MYYVRPYQAALETPDKWAKQHTATKSNLFCFYTKSIINVEPLGNYCGQLQSLSELHFADATLIIIKRDSNWKSLGMVLKAK